MDTCILDTSIMDTCIMDTFIKDAFIIDKCIMDTWIMETCIMDTYMHHQEGNWHLWNLPTDNCLNWHFSGGNLSDNPIYEHMPQKK